MKIELNSFDLMLMIAKYVKEEFPDHQFKIEDIKVNDNQNIEVTLEKDYEKIIEETFK